MTTYDVVYDAPDGIRVYNSVPIQERQDAIDLARRFRKEYVGKPYPNRKGFYPFNNVRVIPHE